MKLLILIPLYALMLFIASAVSECDYFRVLGISPLALARAEFQKDQLFSLLEGEQGHPGTETRDLVLSAEDRTCPLLGL